MRLPGPARTLCPSQERPRPLPAGPPSRGRERRGEAESGTSGRPGRCWCLGSRELGRFCARAAATAGGGPGGGGGEEAGVGRKERGAAGVLEAPREHVTAPGTPETLL